MGRLVEHKDIASIAPSFPEPARFWIDARHESLAQLEAYRHLAPVAGKTVLQIGGSGSHVVKMLLAGAKRGFLITPLISEALYARRLAADFGIQAKFAPVLGIGEQLPFAADSIDLVYSGGCFHHMRFRYLSAELHRCLRKGGKFAGSDPYKTPLHTMRNEIAWQNGTAGLLPVHHAETADGDEAVVPGHDGQHARSAASLHVSGIGKLAQPDRLLLITVPNAALQISGS